MSLVLFSVLLVVVPLCLSVDIPLPSSYTVTPPNPSPNLLQAGYLQRALQWDLPLDQRIVLGSHNSYNADPYTDPCLFVEYPRSQQYSILQQLFYLNVRRLELDVRYVDRLAQFKLCHMSQDQVENFRLQCTNLDSFTTCGFLGFPDYTEDAGCGTNAPTLSDVMTEIKSFLDTNPNEFLFLKVEDYLNTQTSTFYQIVSNAIGTYLYTSNDLAANNGVWPSQRHLNALNKRAALFLQNASPSQSYPFFSYFSYINSLAFFDNFNAQLCLPKSSKTVNLYYSSSKIYNTNGKVMYDESNGTILTHQNLSDAMKCGFAMDIDRVNTSWSEAEIWSWSDGHPSQGILNFAKRCAFWNITSHKFQNHNCLGYNLPFACRNDQNTSDWRISSVVGPWVYGYIADICPSGYRWAVPRSYQENTALLQVASRQNRSLWLNYSSLYQQDCWGLNDGRDPACNGTLGTALEKLQIGISFRIKSSVLSQWDALVTGSTLLATLKSIGASDKIEYLGRNNTSASFLIRARTLKSESPALVAAGLILRDYFYGVKGNSGESRLMQLQVLNMIDTASGVTLYESEGSGTKISSNSSQYLSLSIVSVLISLLITTMVF